MKKLWLLCTAFVLAVTISSCAPKTKDCKEENCDSAKIEKCDSLTVSTADSTVVVK